MKKIIFFSSQSEYLNEENFQEINFLEKEK